MSKLQRKKQYATSKGVIIYKESALKEKNIFIRKDRNFNNNGEYAVFVESLLLYPLAGLTYREAVNMAYEIAVNPKAAFKGVNLSDPVYYSFDNKG